MRPKCASSCFDEHHNVRIYVGVEYNSVLFIEISSVIWPASMCASASVFLHISLSYLRNLHSNIPGCLFPSCATPKQIDLSTCRPPISVVLFYVVFFCCCI